MKQRLSRGLLSVIAICSFAGMVNTGIESVQADTTNGENVEYPPLAPAEESPDKDFETSEPHSQTKALQSPQIQKNQTTSVTSSNNSSRNISNSNSTSKTPKSFQATTQTNPNATQQASEKSNITVKPHAQKSETHKNNSHKKAVNHHKKQTNKRSKQAVKRSTSPSKYVVVGAIFIIVIGAGGFFLKQKLFK